MDSQISTYLFLTFGALLTGVGLWELYDGRLLLKEKTHSKRFQWNLVFGLLGICAGIVMLCRDG